MTRWMKTTAPAALLAVTLGLAVGIGAAGLPKMPGPIPLPKSADSPGQVVFDHESHVDASSPDCTVCHPRPFPFVRTTAGVPQPRLVHDRMDKGEYCGRCHDGKKAFAFDQDCTFCHHME